MIKKEHTIWVEKYRPTNLEEYVGNDHVKKKVAQYIKENDPPHLLFYGKQGTGKTSLAKIIAENTVSDVMYVNASDENSVETVRNKIKGFASSVGFKSLKIIILDECDFISPSGQAALRNLMETFSRTTRFILTANYHEKIIDPIISRCQIYQIVPPTRKDVAVRLGNILKAENIKFDVADIKVLVDATYPDIRQLINSAQMNCMNGELKVDRAQIIESDFRLKLLEILKGKNKKDIFRSVRQLVADNHINDFIEVYRFLYDKIDEFAPNNVANSILILANGIQNDFMSVDKEICFMGTLITLINEFGE